ncbi:MAG: hypothetical protein LCH37_11060 [Bacteroidetes bacterium]|nr:hypothetical protein [Bacteroidota bacterium]
MHTGTPILLSEFIYLLRTQGQLNLYATKGLFPKADKEETLRFLEQEFKAAYPNQIYPDIHFESEAAWWAVNLVTLASGFLVQRELESTQAIASLPDYTNTPTESGILSADLVLCYFPDLLSEFQRLNPEDELIPALKKKLLPFWFSMAGEIPPEETIPFPKKADLILRLFAERVYQTKNLSLANTEPLFSFLTKELGAYAQELWPEFYYTYSHAQRTP